MREEASGLKIVFTSVVALFGTLLIGCALENEGTINAPDTSVPPAETNAQPTREAASNLVIVRVSGTQGTAYSGAYGTFAGAQASDEVLGAGPTDYEVEVGSSSSELVTAVFRKTQPTDEGTLKVEILADGEVVAQDQTSAELGVVNANWSQREGQTGRVVPLE